MQKKVIVICEECFKAKRPDAEPQSVRIQSRNRRIAKENSEMNQISPFIFRCPSCGREIKIEEL